MTESQEESDQRPPEDMVKDAISILGNTVTQTSRIRRKRILKLCNNNLQDLAEEDNLFDTAGQNLFGSKFEVRMKERAESVKLLSKAQKPANRQFFRAGHRHQTQSGGSSSFRGGRVPAQGRGGQSTSRSFQKKQGQ